MIRHETFARKAAIWLAHQSRRALPAHRAEWADAMRNELQYISSDFAALQWALGVLFASCLERIRVMNAESFRLPRWLLSLEMLLCFVPLTFFAAVLVVVLVRGLMPPGFAFLNLSAAAVGPVGLAVAFRMIVLGRIALGKGTIFALGLLAAWTVVAFSSLPIRGNGPIGEWWREYILIALLPAAGAAHLMIIGARTPNREALGAAN